jgi:hypothetical protein
MSELLALLVERAGPVGVVLAIAYLYIRQQHKELAEVQEKRVTDQQAMVAKLLELNDKWNETINAQIEASEPQKQILQDLKSGVQDLKQADVARALRR